MKTRSWIAISLLTLVFGVVSPAYTADEAPGKLLIVGGALEKDNEALYRAFIDGMPQGDRTKIAIIPTASGSPVRSANAFREDLIHYGVPEDRISIVHLALRDDRSTPRVDEAKWDNNATDEDEIAKINEAGAVWFTGGDQTRIVRALVDDEGKDTPMLAALRDLLKRGGMIGGTSAGAAIMSNLMIADGDSLPALLYGFDQPDKGALEMTLGLGFLPYGLVDQHFDARARLGRLVRGMTRLPENARLGFGIDEDTGFLVDLATHDMTVIGPGTLTYVDARDAAFADAGEGLSVTNMRLHVLSGGDRVNVNTGETAIASYKSPTVGDEYYRDRVLSGGGMALAYQDLPQTLGAELLDNSAADSIDRYSFLNSGDGVIYRFTQEPTSQGYFGNDPNRAARYSALDVRFDILPLRITFQETGE